MLPLSATLRKRCYERFPSNRCFKLEVGGVLDCRAVPGTSFTLRWWKRDSPVNPESPSSAVGVLLLCQAEQNQKKADTFLVPMADSLLRGVIWTHEQVGPGTARALVHRAGFRIGQPRPHSTCSALLYSACVREAPQIAARVWARAEF